MKYWQAVAIVIFMAVAYLAAAHYYIYHTIGVAKLKASDNRHTYMINPEITAERGLVYVALGDSLTAGVGTERYEQSYPYLISQKLAGIKQKVTHLNFSYPGARTDDLIRDLLAKAVADQPNLVTLLIGTNDVHGNVSSARFERNYKHILEELTAKTQAKINVINIPSIGADTLLLPPYKDYYQARIEKFNNIIKNLANIYQINHIDLATHTAGLSPGGNGYYAEDQFHPSASGYKIWADFIYDHLNR